MDKPILKGRPPNTEEIYIKEKYLESLTKQPDLMNDVAKQLLTLELAIPGLYASVLKLTSGKDTTVVISNEIYFVFSCWIISLICIIAALFPRSYAIDPDNHTQLRNSFFTVALYKFGWIAASAATFVAGLGFVIWDLIT